MDICQLLEIGIFIINFKVKKQTLSKYLKIVVSVFILTNVIYFF